MKYKIKLHKKESNLNKKEKVIGKIKLIMSWNN
jgi:hypothetical protein